jgi:hypothetical protein
MVVHAYAPSYTGEVRRRITVQAGRGKKKKKKERKKGLQWGTGERCG